MDKLKKMFGEPAAAVGLIQLVLTAVLTFNTGLTQDWVAVIMGLVYAAAAVYNMIVTKTVALAVIVEALKATVAFTAALGFTLTDAQFASIVGGVAFVIGLYQRTQTGVAINPGLHDEPVWPVVVPGQVLSVSTDGTGTGAVARTEGAYFEGGLRRGMPAPS